jgi:hypothetical protein
METPILDRPIPDSSAPWPLSDSGGGWGDGGGGD